MMKRRSASVCLLLALTSPAVPAADFLGIFDLALARDPKLHEVEAARDAALESRPQSVARLLPSLSVSASMTRNSVLSKFDAGNQTQQFIAGGRNIGFWNSQGQISLNQPVYHHELWVQLGQADNRIAQAEAELAAEQQHILVRVAEAYLGILYAQDDLRFAQGEREAIERQLEQAKARFEVGLAAITDVNEAQAGFDQATAAEIKAENGLDNAREALREILGHFEEGVAGLAEDIPLQPPNPENIDQWSQRAQEDNLTIIAAQNKAELAEKGVDLQFSGHLPTVDIVGSASFSDTNRPRGIGSESQVIGMQVNMPLFQGGLVSSRVRQARHEFESAQQALDRQRRAVTKQVKNAYRAIVSSISQVKALKAAVKSSESALEASQAGFEVGTRTMVEVLTEQRNLFRAQRDYAKARYDYILATLSLKEAASILTRLDAELINRWLVK